MARNTRWTHDDVAAAQHRIAAPPEPAPDTGLRRTPKRNKYSAKKTMYAGVMYDSKAEARVALELDLRLKAGELREVCRQVPIEIRWPGSLQHICTIRVDFMLTHADGRLTLLEVKGYRVRDWPVKEKLLRASGWTLEVRGLATRKRKVARKTKATPAGP